MESFLKRMDYTKDMLSFLDVCSYKSSKDFYISASVRFVNYNNNGVANNIVFPIGQWLYKIDNFDDCKNDRLINDSKMYDFMFSLYNDLYIFSDISPNEFLMGIYINVLVRIFCMYFYMDNTDNVLKDYFIKKVLRFFYYKKYTGRIYIFFSVE